jgi:hypothetical protein
MDPVIVDAFVMDPTDTMDPVIVDAFVMDPTDTMDPVIVDAFVMDPTDQRSWTSDIEQYAIGIIRNKVQENCTSVFFKRKISFFTLFKICHFFVYRVSPVFIP